MIDIIIPTHNHLGTTIDCLEGLYANAVIDFSLTIIDDSTDLTPNYIRSTYPHINLIRPEEKLVHANQIINIGLKQTTSEIVGFMTNSSRVCPQWGHISPSLFNNPKVGLVGYKLIYPSGVVEHAGMYWKPEMAHHQNYGVGEPAQNCTYIAPMQLVGWAVVLMRRDAFREPLDETTFLGFRGYDDVDNCMELSKRGWDILYCGYESAYHYARVTRGQNTPEYAAECEENRRRFLRKWGGTQENIDKDIIGVI